MQLPYALEMRGIHTFLTVAGVYNSHETPYLDFPGRYDARLYYTSNWGVDIGIQQQIGHFTAHLTVDVINWMRYVEFGAGYTFYKLRR